MDDELGLVRRLFVQVAGQEFEVTTPSQKLAVSKVMLEKQADVDAPFYFYEGNERVYTGSSLFAERLGGVF